MSKFGLSIISSYNPTNVLIECVTNIQNLYPEFDIVVVDSDSSNIDTYKQINVEVIMAKNKNFEMGAYKIASSKYPNYTMYMCIQDTFIPTSRVEFDPNNVYLWYHPTGFTLHWETLPYAREFFKNTQYAEFLEKHSNTNFTLAFASNFICSRAMLQTILSTSPNFPKNKMGSCTYERLLGLIFLYHNCNIIDVKNNFKKINLSRS